ncbi:MAG: DUF2970 domain-containing protein [Burkholderiaceae bacterium]|nr:DUF2970 domain-containing protein [Burkholderiaceae bacterium]MBP6651071.1 DUF2970 domain-containing protein [Xylophilus sp.]MBP7420756.1 DUF2970 domain-containing protein [Burkholderiaceae bacterium]MBP8230278.1 DUF2970 domain-containing protein [Xylophilus sp.]
MQPQHPVAEQPKSSLLRTIKMVAWSFIGLRKGSEFEQDIKMNPLHIVAVGIAGAILFVLALVALVNWVV